MPPFFGELLPHILIFISLYFEVFLLVTFFERREEISKESPEPKAFPTATVIVPCFNEEKTVAGTLDSLLALDYPKDKLAIFAIDDGSTDGTWKVMQAYKDHPQIRLFQKENEGSKYKALNLGLAHATSEIVGCLDADSFVDPKALKRIVLRFENPETMAVTPAIKLHQPKNFIQMMQRAEYSFSVLIRKVFALIGSVYITPGPFSFFRKSVFDTLGPYRHAHHTEDLEIGLRMQTKDYRIDNAHDAYVYTVAPSTLRGLFKQRVRWVHGFLENALDYRQIFFKRRYGNLSMFILPLAVLSVFSALYFAAYTLFYAGLTISEKVTEIRIIGLTLDWPRVATDWFFLNTESLMLLSIALILITFALLVTGKAIGREKLLSRDMLYFMVCYGFVAPWWLLKSVYNTAFSRKTSWR
ncbi:MAG TPA: glycosyltransferase family 2 protein [Candidatus Paceibacterota bacterium]|nr:glycosyltransferase family 2 protein [Candidatus Paceibacterota bacterium]